MAGSSMPGSDEPTSNPGIDAVIERLRSDTKFTDLVRIDPARALLGYRLGADDLLRIDRLLDPGSNPLPNLFTPTDPD